MVDNLAAVEDHFELTNLQRDQLVALHALHVSMRDQLNLISRGDVDHLWTRHILHSLTIAKFLPQVEEASCLDLGTGGGFPCLPLAILRPQYSFVAIDGRQKKINAVQEIVDHLSLSNVKPLAIRAEDFSGTFQFVLARAVAPLSKLLKWAQPLFDSKGIGFFLKGGDLSKEIQAVSSSWTIQSHDLSKQFNAPFFSEKFLLEIKQKSSA